MEGSKAARAALAVALLAAGGLALSVVQLRARMPGSGEATMPSFSDFTVDTADGVLSLSDLQGQVVVVYFGYASCPDICPTTLSTAGAAVSGLTEEEQAQVAGIFVSVDPERDSLPRLAEYARFFHPHFRGGTADSTSLAQIGEDWGVGWEKAPGASDAMGYTVDHTSILFLVGPNGRMRKAVPHGSAPDRLTEEIRGLLGSSGT